MSFVLGLIIGVALGTIVVAFLALDAFERGVAHVNAAPWRRELRARAADARRQRAA